MTRATATSRPERCAPSRRRGSLLKQQHRIRIDGKTRRIDLAYPDLMIAIELDSWEYHGRNNLTAFTDDRAKKNDLIAKGWAAPSFTESMSDEYFVTVIRQLYEAAIRRQGAA